MCAAEESRFRFDMPRAVPARDPAVRRSRRDHRAACGAPLRRIAATALLLALAHGAAAQAPPEPAGPPSAPPDVTVTASYRYEDNVTRAPSGPDRLSEHFYALSIDKEFRHLLGEHTQVLAHASIDGELAQRHPGLGRIAGELRGALQYRGSAAFDAPTFALFGSALAESYGSSLRGGYRYAAGVSVLQPVTDRITVFARYAHHWRYARSAVFNTREDAVLVNVDYAVAPRGNAYLSGEYRRGSVVSTGQPTLQIVDIAELFVRDDVFTDPQMINYRFEATTLLATLGYNLPLGPDSSLDISWRRIQSRSQERPGFAGGTPLEYVDNQFVVACLFRF